MKFASEINRQIENLKTLSIGARNSPVTVKNFKASNIPDSDGITTDNIFDVIIDVCGSSKTFQIMFDLEHPTFCPDVILSPDDDNFFPDMNSLKGFSQWDISADGALTDLVSDLYVAYAAHMRAILLSYPQLSNEMKDLMSNLTYGPTCEVDIIKNGPGTYNDTVKLLIPIKLDYSCLPPYVKSKSPGKEGCRLCLSYEPPNLSKVTPSLELSPSVQNAFTRGMHLRIPSYGKCSLLVYVSTIHCLVESTVSEISKGFKRREKFIFYVLSEIGDQLLEYDAVTFYDATFLLEINGYYFILFVILNPKFPAERPSLFLQSIYSVDASSDIFRMSIQGYPFDSDWDDKEMFHHMKKSVFENIEDFQDKSSLDM